MVNMVGIGCQKGTFGLDNFFYSFQVEIKLFCFEDLASIVRIQCILVERCAFFLDFDFW